MKNNLIGIILGAAYVTGETSTSWILTVIIGIIAIAVLYFVYRNVAKKKTKEIVEEEKAEKREAAREEEERKNRPVMAEDNPPDAEGVVKIEPKEEHPVVENLAMPIAGRLMSLTEVPDPVFSQKMMGDGCAIEPREGDVFSPVNGRVKSIFSTHHAITLESSVGHEILIHFGMDTVSLKGEGFEACVTEEQEVKVGDLLLKVDLKTVMSHGKSTITPIIFANLKEDEQVVIRETGQVEAGMTDLVMVEKKS